MYKNCTFIIVQYMRAPLFFRVIGPIRTAERTIENVFPNVTAWGHWERKMNALFSMTPVIVKFRWPFSPISCFSSHIQACFAIGLHATQPTTVVCSRYFLSYKDRLPDVYRRELWKSLISRLVTFKPSVTPLRTRKNENGSKIFLVYFRW